MILICNNPIYHYCIENFLKRSIVWQFLVPLWYTSLWLFCFSGNIMFVNPGKFPQELDDLRLAHDSFHEKYIFAKALLDYFDSHFLWCSAIDYLHALLFFLITGILWIIYLCYISRKNGYFEGLIRSVCNLPDAFFWTHWH